MDAPVIVAAVAWICCVVALAGLALELANLPEFPVLQPGQRHVRRCPTVVACVAMRNEAANAEGCIASLLTQPEIAAIVVCDDDSVDGTAAKLSALAEREPRLSVVTVPENNAPGKSRALARAAASPVSLDAQVLFFTDADVRLAPGAIAALLDRMELASVDAVSAWPRTVAGSWWDAAFSSQTILLLLQALPLRLARLSPDARFAAATGQLFLVDAAAYRRSGGHETSAALVEDVALARTLKRAGARIALASAATIASVAGYGGFVDNVGGYGRSLLLGAGRLGALAYGIWQTCAFVVPWLLLPFAPLPASIGCAAALTAHVIAARLSGAPRVPWRAIFAGSPLAAAAGFWFAIAGARRLRWRARHVFPAATTTVEL